MSAGVYCAGGAMLYINVRVSVSVSIIGSVHPIAQRGAYCELEGGDDIR